MVEIVTVEGPLVPDHLDWVARLYGQADPKYRGPEFLEHLFGRNPAGAALHAFALDEGRPVGHCAVVPMRARYGGDGLRCGKVEALFVEESHRGRRSGHKPVALELRDRLYACAEGNGIELLHAYVRPAVGRVLGLEALRVGERSLVAITRPPTLARAVLGGLQRLVRESAHSAARLGRRTGTSVRAPASADADLVAAPPAPPGQWTVLAEDSWDWYRASPVLRVLEIAGPHGCRALVQVPGSPGDSLRVVGWRPERGGLVPALLLLGAAGRLARESGAGTLRFQPWPGLSGDGMLKRGCRLLGFVPREDFTTLWVQSRRPELTRAEAVGPTPLLFLGF